MRLSKFIKTKLTDCQYEDGKAFYEMVENEEATKQEDTIEIEENILYCKKILRPNKNEVFNGIYLLDMHACIHMIRILCVVIAIEILFSILCSSAVRN